MVNTKNFNLKTYVKKSENSSFLSHLPKRRRSLSLHPAPLIMLIKRTQSLASKLRATTEMGSIGNKGRPLPSHQAPLCTRTHQIGSLLLVFTTFFLTRLLDRSSPPCSYLSPNYIPTPQSHVGLTPGGSLSWPERGYGSHLSLKIYVYDEDEISGLKPLMYGRDGRITAEACSKGQWGTQVISRSVNWFIG